ncbi:hypothetical protein NEUTE1DRAFT_38714 [Neurospora tetrasperma FGSC 2508]|uniref:Gfd2/YDR514C-like C-terminal domain-containing protein n=1 Tax=Neurospora tetrasperma (strain FGSC 2508 / ATCC MYA-4615 / P0657) TaxID=510951 RepID=F8MGW0_NEUT8|nr:uncharacterized protein NEUTE1DRAFT_38714 [Neurospora tetrasperma FGSC 2508]EGO58679.1 hypothetical protein NEUTE1DRAFT_38714 [Neurospora tetrasperma FGSC 2508]EGZ72766.1 hypothetical protein NEUTE2DRAFT_127142 [Neurospora tetrasperma FGSC 2509]
MVVKTPASPYVWDFEGLCAFRDTLKDTIIVAIDLEGVDHLVQKRGQPATTAYDKLSEVGIAIYDPRDNLKTPTSNPADIESIGPHIKAQHTIIHEFRRVTEETCPAFYHKKFGNKPHSARPYHCAFARSIVKTKEKALNDLKDTIKQLCSQNRTDAEVKSGKDRSVRILYWAAHMEETVFHLGGLDLTAAGSDVKIWDLQLWSVFQIRFHKPQTKGEEVFSSLGALGEGFNLHNATNDCVAQLLALIRVLSMKEAEWTTWFVQYIDASPLAMDWLNASILQHNYNMRPRSLHERNTRPNQGTSTQRHERLPSPPKRVTKPTPRYTSNDFDSQAPSAPGVGGMVPGGTSSNHSAEEKTAKRSSGKKHTSGSATDQWWAAYEARKDKISSTMATYKKPIAAVAPSTEEVGTGWPAEMEWAL